MSVWDNTGEWTREPVSVKVSCTGTLAESEILKSEI